VSWTNQFEMSRTLRITNELVCEDILPKTALGVSCLKLLFWIFQFEHFGGKYSFRLTTFYAAVGIEFNVAKFIFLVFILVVNILE
jgi:hypothetical protein